MNVNGLRIYLLPTALLAVSVMWTVSAIAEAPPEGFKSLFDGKSLEGWNGVDEVWKVEDGMIVGETPGRKNNEFLATNESYGDFELQVSFRLKDGKGNSGVQFRSVRIPDHHEMIGYQADVGDLYWGCLYDESRRNRVLVRPSKEALAKLDKSGWNKYVIRCKGAHITMTLNDVVVVDYTEADADIAKSGLIALQVHSSSHPTRVEFKDIFIRSLGEK